MATTKTLMEAVDIARQGGECQHVDGVGMVYVADHALNKHAEPPLVPCDDSLVLIINVSGMPWLRLIPPSCVPLMTSSGRAYRGKLAPAWCVHLDYAMRTAGGVTNAEAWDHRIPVSELVKWCLAHGDDAAERARYLLSLQHLGTPAGFVLELLRTCPSSPTAPASSVSSPPPEPRPL